MINDPRALARIVEDAYHSGRAYQHYKKEMSEYADAISGELFFHSYLGFKYSLRHFFTQRDSADMLPFWQYSAMVDASGIPSHAALDGSVFRWNDPVWNEIYPPNGLRCRCRVIALSARAFERQKIKLKVRDGSEINVSAICEPGWNLDPCSINMKNPVDLIIESIRLSQLNTATKNS